MKEKNYKCVYEFACWYIIQMEQTLYFCYFVQYVFSLILLLLLRAVFLISATLIKSTETEFLFTHVCIQVILC